ncbi:MAG: hypothetical protein V9H25_13685 [Candidatus Competibacter sp.]
MDDAFGQRLQFLAQAERRPLVRGHQRGGERFAHVVGEPEQPRHPVQETVERVKTGGALLGFDTLMRFANDESAAGRLAHAGHRPASAPFLVMAQFAGATDITDLVARGSPRRQSRHHLLADVGGQHRHSQLPRLGWGRRCENGGLGELIDRRRPDGVGQADTTQRDPQHDHLDEAVTVDQRDQHRGGKDDPDRGPGGGAVLAEGLALVRGVEQRRDQLDEHHDPQQEQQKAVEQREHLAERAGIAGAQAVGQANPADHRPQNAFQQVDTDVAAGGLEILVRIESIGRFGRRRDRLGLRGADRREQHHRKQDRR